MKSRGSFESLDNKCHAPGLTIYVISGTYYYVRGENIILGVLTNYTKIWD